MNPNIETSAGMGLPQPVEAQQNWGQSAETAPNNENFASVPEAQGAAMAQPAFPTSNARATDWQTTSTVAPMQPAVAGAPSTATDDDLIDKAWVVKAKQIVAATKLDPYQQNQQLAAFKADYLQKRYNKTVKLSE